MLAFADTTDTHPQRGVSFVPAYRLYHLDGAGSVSSAEWLEAIDDESATDTALLVPKRAVTVELWLGNRRVACLDGNGVTSGDDD